MNEKLMNYKNKIVAIWGGRTRKQKIIFIGTILAVIAFVAGTSWYLSRPTMVPLYSDLSPAETGKIKENLDSRGVPYEIGDAGKTILVPQEQVDTLKVDLAAEGIPESGSIDYSFFGQNAGLGMTDNEFGVLQLEATQTELANLLKGIDGVNKAKVMISLPEKGVFVSDTDEQASASIVLDTKPGYKFQDDQIKALYHLVSKSVPNLPTENIVIMNQAFEYFDLEENNNSTNAGQISNQLGIKKEIERDIQRQVQNMLGTIMGRDKVVVSVTADIDFNQVKSEQNLVEPVDPDNMEGIAISAQRLNETFTGNGAAGGVPQAGEPADTLAPGYQEGANGNGDYEKTDETINYEVNRVRKEIVESPYKVRDLGIQVMVEPPTADDPNSLPQERVDDITKILSTIIRTTVDKGANPEGLTDDDLNNKIAVSVQEFNGKVKFDTDEKGVIPIWVYIVGGVLIVALIAAIILYLRARKRKQEEEEEQLLFEEVEDEIPDVNEEVLTEGAQKRKQLEKLAKEKPEEFAKLLRTWLTQD
ncbi:flagellar basal-body MS-ring/collar protein FliF [Bacillus massiliigorillae]|uniref:flagellar basal-body MS-ring/collar protein FliF n=1 Tax=Bacillus massiliigorillae TaxID=1243664 RepID=UPI00039A67F4|nr:flagellar basal-body MS-ring/collar protein FliF [Bacillus massiliigorillae]